MNQKEFEHCAYPGCKRKLLETSKDGYCIFHAKAEEKDVREFGKALKDYMEEIKTKDSDYNFNGFIFLGDINFRKYFELTVFKDVYFGAAEFHGDVHFEGVKFQKNVRFEKVDFWKDAVFQEAKFSGDTYFDRVEFHRIVVFVRARFRGYTTFLDVAFHEPAFFSGAEFRGRTYISLKLIKKSISFVLANLENVSLTPLNLDKNACIYFTRARLKNTEIRRKDIEDHIAQKKEKKFSEAKEVYLLLKDNFHSLGRYDDESWAFKKEKDMERKSYFHFLRLYIDQELGGSQNGKPNFCLCPRAWWFCLKYSLKWSASMFWNILYGYGERPFWILAWCAGLLLLSSVIYWMSKGILKIVGVQTISVEDYWNSLYFSVVTFTTLGYGDFRPIGKVKILASIEAILGIFFVALLIITFARKTAGR